jgi:hypothetical protein
VKGITLAHVSVGAGRVLNGEGRKVARKLDDFICRVTDRVAIWLARFDGSIAEADRQIYKQRQLQSMDTVEEADSDFVSEPEYHFAVPGSESAVDHSEELVEAGIHDRDEDR